MVNYLFFILLGKPYSLSLAQYASLYGPTKGDIIHLGDTGLKLKIEHDFTIYGEEMVFGGGKVIREGMGQATGVESQFALDTGSYTFIFCFFIYWFHFYAPPGNGSLL